MNKSVFMKKNQFINLIIFNSVKKIYFIDFAFFKNINRKFQQKKIILNKMESFVNRKLFVGQKLAKYKGEALGYGLYEYNQSIYASVIGILKYKHPNQYFVENNLPVKCVGLQIGDIVYCQVSKIKQEEAFVNIVQVNSNTVNKNIQASIRKEHVRQKLVDQVIMNDSFKPGDYIKAKIISLGDSLRNLYLSTAGQDLGVLVAKNEKSDNLMLPFDWQSMVDPTMNQFQKRKVAKPQL